jgi:hypothetical protein
VSPENRTVGSGNLSSLEGPRLRDFEGREVLLKYYTFLKAKGS